MPSSISSSEAASFEAASSVLAMAAADGIAKPERFERPGFVRLTASDRPGVAQPVPVRDIPPQPWNRIFLVALVLFAMLMIGWELYWRAFGATPGYQNSDGMWAMQRRRIDHGEGNATVLIGSSRVLFDVQLPVWQRLSGERPIQLALEGTTSLLTLEDLAADPNFTGRLLVGIAPDIFFSGRSRRAGALKYFHHETPSQRLGQWLSMHLAEPLLAFDDPDFALATVVKRQPWPARPGLHSFVDVRKLLVTGADRNGQIWSKVETDPAYQALVRKIWLQFFGPPPPGAPSPAQAHKIAAEQITRAAKAVATLRARGVEVLFVRMPSTGPWLAFENKVFPRAQTWDVLLQRTATPGIHFEDYPQLQGYTLPEWSHLSAADAQRFTAALVPLVKSEFAHEEAQMQSVAR
ncbi:MAG TPA: hypothetical protein VHF02_00030 [Luteimonas sp.]|nr:hypothetical protein [Luteimonas sp.]